jgi:hypothetical protein
VFIKEKSAEQAVEASRRIKPGTRSEREREGMWRLTPDKQMFKSGQERLTNLRRGERKKDGAVAGKAG